MYTIETHNTKRNINVNMSSLKGYLTLEKSKLVELFGEPIDFGGGGKVINEWELELTDENGDSGVITIYDWKNYGMEELPDNYARWNIGGHKSETIRALNELLAQLNVSARAGKEYNF